MTQYVISADPSAATALASAAREIGGKPFHSSCWLVSSPDTADGLALKLQREIHARVVVCRADGDWSYR